MNSDIYFYFLRRALGCTHWTTTKRIQRQEVKMKVAILRSENRSKVPGETCFDGKYFQKQEMETELKNVESESVIAVKQ